MLINSIVYFYHWMSFALNGIRNYDLIFVITHTHLRSIILLRIWNYWWRQNTDLEAVTVDKFNDINCWYYVFFSLSTKYVYLAIYLRCAIVSLTKYEFIFKINSLKFIIIHSDVFSLLLLSDRISCKIVQLRGHLCVYYLFAIRLNLHFYWYFSLRVNLSVSCNEKKETRKNCGLML